MMTRQRIWILIAATVTCTLHPLYGETITFEPPPPVNNGAYVGFFGTLVLGSAEINTHGEFVATLGAGAIGMRQTVRAITPPNVAVGLGIRPGGAEFFRDLEGAFFTPAGSLVPGLTDYLSFYVVDTQPGQRDEWVARIYGLPMPGGQPIILDSVSGTTDAEVVFFRPVSDIWIFTLATTGSFEGIDNVTFNPPITSNPTPEATSGILCGGGLIIVLLISRLSRPPRASTHETS